MVLVVLTPELEEKLGQKPELKLDRAQGFGIGIGIGIEMGKEMEMETVIVMVMVMGGLFQLRNQWEFGVQLRVWPVVVLATTFEGALARVSKVEADLYS